MARKKITTRLPLRRRPADDDLTESLETEERIRRRSYELYLERGGVDGFALEDWLRAEAEILGKKVRSAHADG